MGLVFDKCCFYIDLRKGCLIIGYLDLIGYIVTILLSVLSLAGVDVDTVLNIQIMGAGMTAITSIILLSCIISLVFNIVLLVGLRNYKRIYVKAYLIYAPIFLVVDVILFAASLGSAHIIIGGIIARVLITTIINIYFLLVIRSYYLKMNDPDNKPAVYNTA